MSANTDALIESNTPELGPNETPLPRRGRSLDSIWPKHTCGASEWAVGVSACACGAAMGMLVVFALCNSASRND